MAQSQRYYCRYCGCCTTSFAGKPPAKWNRKCSGNLKTGLHSWIKG